jgi:hypothetical protein
MLFLNMVCLTVALTCWWSLGTRQRIAQNEDNGVTAKEHFGDVAVLVHWLGLLLAFARLERGIQDQQMKI